MNWASIVQQVSPHIVQIEAQTANKTQGTGFLCRYDSRTGFCYVATVAHVVAEANKSHQPLSLRGYTSDRPLILGAADRYIWEDTENDCAIIRFCPKEFPIPRSAVPLRPIDSPISSGVEVGWLGFPSIAITPNPLCFFSGSVSAHRTDRSGYLIDGIAVNGVSGGPVIVADVTGTQFVGVVRRYLYNRGQGGDTLPGLLIAQSVSHLHKIIEQIDSKHGFPPPKNGIKRRNRKGVSSPPARNLKR